MKEIIARTKVVACLLALVVMLGIPPLAMAEDPVIIPDPNLKAAIESALGIIDPTPTDMLLLTDLYAGDSGNRQKNRGQCFRPDPFADKERGIHGFALTACR